MAAVLSSCSTPSKTPEPTRSDAAFPTPDGFATSLSKEAATNRARQISNISYDLWFGLNENEDSFQGRTEIQFELKAKTKERGGTLWVDLEGGTLLSVSLNGKPLSDFKSAKRFDGHHLYLSVSELIPSTNQVVVSYSHPYSTDGNGLHRFKDPVDGKVYLYSNFEPYNAHRLFPCFDQPDLKASYEVTVEAPETWQVISNTPERDVTAFDGRKSWQFPRSAAFSTYVFALLAGPYAKWESNANGIPIRLFARASLTPYIDHAEWFEVTKKGLDFFSTFFGYPYPFIKYDQIIVPDFNAGAMENVAAVTFTEKTVYRTRVTQDRRRTRAGIILHEMAHMWFGNLVTMKWWNGLWLNESFATFTSSLAVDQATSFPGTWQSFFGHSKQSGYWEDQLVTTHPIELPVPDTLHAEAIFDGITYGKGASSLKQLSYYIGEEQFKEGLQRYFQKFAFKNTTLADFIKMLSEASGQDLTSWQKAWLQTSGVNPLRAQWQCTIDPKTQESLVSELKLIQTPTKSGLRPHKTLVAFYDFPRKGKFRTLRGTLTSTRSFEVTYQNAETPVTEAIGEPCPDLVFPNEKDFDYAKVELDPISLKIVSANLSQISDPLTRQMVWHSLWEMVVDGKLKSQDYANIVLKHAAQERDSQVLARILGSVSSLNANQASVLKYLEGDQRKAYQAKIEAFARRGWLTSAPGSDLQLIWYQAYLDVASSSQALGTFSRLLETKGRTLIVKGMPLDQERRWEIVQAWARTGSPIEKIGSLIEENLKQDPTDMGEKQAISARAAIPDESSKREWLEKMIAEPRPLPAAKLRQAMGPFHVLGQEEFTRASVNTYFEQLPKIAMSDSKEDQEFAGWFSGAMYPSLCDPMIIEKTDALLTQYPHLPSKVERALLIKKQEEERCIRARKMASPAPEAAQDNGLNP